MLNEALSKSSSSNGLRIAGHQDIGSPIHKEEIISIVSSSPAIWGSQFLFDLRETNVLVLENTIALTLTAITDASGTNFNYVPSQYMTDHLDYLCNGNIVQTYYPDSNFIQQQLFLRDEDRGLANFSNGLYSSQAQRVAMATQQTTFYINLYDYMKASNGFPMLETTHNHQIRVTLPPLSSVVCNTTGAYSASIVSANLLQRVVRLRDEEANHLRKEMVMYRGLTYKSPDIKRQTYAIASGQTSVTVPLQSITGNVSVLQFFVRNASPNSVNFWTFLPVASFEIRNSAGSNICGGYVIPQSQALLLMGNRYTKSSYLGETALGATNNNAYVYTYSYTHDPEHACLWGAFDGCYNFVGSESLILNFASATGSYQVDINAYCQSAIVETKGGVNKISL